ncbi:hypothetical protein [Thioclava sp. F1Mire-8]|uniref:hypothetical protein n=1 Tax=Thioclava sp. F1Mire-8 TaxID=1973006 RepID=UPI0011BCFD85|nr:hypothetical protein [Thioclava sp. F1Mire-8]
MILEPPEDKILEKLAEQPDGCWTAGELKGFTSGAAILDAIRKLEAKRIVDFRRGEVCLTAFGLELLDHPSGRLRRKVAKGGKLTKGAAALAIAAFSFVAGFMADNISPQAYCPILPKALAGILTPCIDQQSR